MIVYDELRFDELVAPVWEGGRVLEESVMFFGEGDRKSLLYRIDDIISVKSMDLETEYVRGKDYELDDGCIVLLENTSIPYMTRDIYYDSPTITDFLLTRVDGKFVPTYWGEGRTMTKFQVAVTYTHSGVWKGPIPPVRRECFKNFLSKLERGEDATMFFCGDSVTAGANATAKDGLPPFMPTWPELVALTIAKKYKYRLRYVSTDFDRGSRLPKTDKVFGDRGTLTMINTAVGGWRVKNGILDFEVHGELFLRKYGCDLLILGFGGNDGKNTLEEEHRYLSRLAHMFFEHTDAELMFISPMVNNPEAQEKWYGIQPQFQGVMEKLCEELSAEGHPSATVPMADLTGYILTKKKFRDYSANNINHLNDFGIRIYAAAVLRTLMG